MLPNPIEQRPRYHTFLLSLWEETASAPGWRYSLENPHTGERRGFKTLDELTAYLREWTQKPPPEQRPVTE